MCQIKRLSMASTAFSKMSKWVLHHSLSHLVPRCPTSSHVVPPRPTSSHVVPHRPMLSHIVPHCPMLSHIVPRWPTSSHIVPRWPTSSYVVPRWPSLSHIVPHRPTLAHIVPHRPTSSHVVLISKSLTQVSDEDSPHYISGLLFLLLLLHTLHCRTGKYRTSKVGSFLLNNLFIPIFFTLLASAWNA